MGTINARARSGAPDCSADRSMVKRAMPETPPVAPRKRRLLRAAVIVGALFVAYTAFGFLAAPPLARNLLVKQASAALHRDVEIAKVRVNPLALSVTIEGLAVRHRDGAPFIGWESLYVRAAPLRLFAGDLGLAEIRLVRPSLQVGLDRDGALTFQDLLEPEGASPAPAPEPATNGGGGLGLSIGRLAIEDARVGFDDATRNPAFHTVLGPVTVKLDSFRTKGGGDSPYSFTGSTDAGETFRWTGTVRTQPFRSAGTLAFERIALPRYAPYLQDELPIELREGLLDFETTYDLEWGTARRILGLSDGKVTVDGLAVGPRGVTDPPVKLPRIEVAGIGVDAIAQVAKVGEVTLRGGTLRVVREADGSLELARMAPPPSPPTAWKWSVASVAISGVALTVEDRTTARPAILPLTDVQLRLENLRDAVDSTWPMSASLVWNGRGRLSVKGPVQPFAAKGTLELHAADLELLPLQPYLESALAARLSGGSAGADLVLGFDASEPEPRWTATGDVRVDGLSFTEKSNDELLRWQALEISGIDAGSTPPHASVRLVRLVQPRTKIYVWQDGTTSLSRAVLAPGAQPAPSPESPAPSTAPAARAPEWKTRIGTVQLVRGRATFIDRSVTPAAVVNVTSADGKVTSLSSDPRVRSNVDARLELEGASPIAIAGTLNPLQKDANAELLVTSRGVDLSPLGPYAGKFLGYGIQKGKLDLELRYKIEDRSVVATNVVKVNQFTLGDETKSPDATKLPVRLALALLQDRDGVILLDVPVEGNLDDPEFRLGKVIWRTILNVLTKVATSPFSALAALAGGGDADLSMVEFVAGSADPLPEAQERFTKLATSLAQRPGLMLDVEGAADAERDGPALRRAALERSLRLAKAATLRPPPPSTDGLTLAPDERPRLVRTVYDAAFPATPPKRGEAAPPPVGPEEMEARLAAAAEVPADAYRALAAERAQRARDALIAAGVDQARLFLAQGGRAEKENGARVYFTLK